MGRRSRGPALAGPRFLLAVLIVASVGAAETVREAVWAGIPLPIQQLLASHGFSAQSFNRQLAEIRVRNRQRVRDGDVDHLIYYALQSTSFTSLSPIEPALSAKEFFATGRIPAAAKARLDAFLHGGGKTARLRIFREMVARERIDLTKEYARAMKGAAPVGADYQVRGLSTDTSIDAGYAVYLSLAALRRLEPQRKIRSVLIVGPGMDLAPRTGFVESKEPQSYQPFAVMDALMATGLSQLHSLRITAADINPRVVQWIARVRGNAPTLTLAPGVTETGTVKLSDDYREYFAALGRTIGVERPLGSGPPFRAKGLALRSGVDDVVDAAPLDVTIERLDGRYDLIVVTNVFPYLSDPEVLLAIGNISAMLNAGGILIHNEPRPALAQALAALEMPLLQNRSAVVATVQGRTPLYDAVWMHINRDSSAARW